MPKDVSLDNTIEFLKGRVYLGAYDYTPENTDEIVFFTIEDTLYYNSFHLDFGPMNIGHLYRFAVILHEILNDPINSKKSVVFYSSTFTRERANSACLLCCYMILVQGWTPHQVLQPLAQVDPPFMPFRDAGYSNADFEITIQDIVYGVWRAKEKGLIDLKNFNLEDYERYEHVEEGDFNVLTPDFIAFASPQEENYKLNRNPIVVNLNRPFKSVLNFFKDNNVQLVVRLNSHLYNKRHFETIGIQHLDMIFEDGTCPDLSIVQNFVGAAETIIKKGGKIAVHCKAGLGRTGCLIGAHLIYTYGFTANECIGFLRFIRPGMVVGPQQHWLYLNQNNFRDWKHTMRISLEPSEIIGGLYPLIPLDEYRQQKRAMKESALYNDDNNVNDEFGDSLTMTPPRKIRNNNALNDRRLDNRYQTVGLPQNSPGQPRKGQNGTYTIENIDKKNGTKKSPVEDGDGDIIMKSNNDSKVSSSSIGHDDDADRDTLLRQLLPKNKRAVSGKRITSASGIRKTR
ncbi:phosphoprotein phosphatase CDC14 NDAI_0B04610 [Naumovozyma dairenensis CBS 421]|uniref:Tyrosine-protein phosphatase CDC14 n=1 Tax=Naumovozyma dairenensis (strain ATCC 10597 / BCRC 20456 / CBS 421 / NBRC 0211 / NRRL Y-12639) TaxID=1071378 RepID=G0W6T5_NAUDC|nr:hypothetical protein NDAI_0B04610 [Naumovozyma dairenensis CBS 421]CCD23496.1 hypothetical protein NDAI_0B04610 [Naumovozyma dairenensis CBS 421]